jgi:fibronectin-binding autotransporter adhesin
MIRARIDRRSLFLTTAGITALAAAMPAQAQQVIDAGSSVHVPGDHASPWNIGNTLTVGSTGTGTMTIDTGATVTNTNATIGDGAAAQGQVWVDGGGTVWTSSVLTIGNHGTGGVNAMNGATINSNGGVIGMLAGSTGTVSIDGAGTKWVNSNAIGIGLGGNGGLSITGGAQVSNTSVTTGGTGGLAQIDVAGTGSRWTNTSMLLGGTGTSRLFIYQAGAVTADSIGMAMSAGGNSTIRVNDSGSSLTVTGQLAVGALGDAQIFVEDGGQLTSGSAIFGAGASGAGVVSLTGAGTKWTNGGDILLGQAGTGSIGVSNGATLINANFLALGLNAGSSGQVGVSGAGSLLDNQGGTQIGDQGSLQVQDGGKFISAGALAMGAGAGMQSYLTLDTGGVAQLDSGMVAGAQGAATIGIYGGARFDTNALSTLGSGAAGSGEVQMSGAGTTWNAAGIRIGEAGTGSLSIGTGAAVNATAAISLGRSATGEGTLKLSDNGSTLVGTDLVIGENGNGHALFETGSSGSFTGAVSIGRNANSVGGLTLEGAGTQFSAGQLIIGYDHADAAVIVHNGAQLVSTSAVVGRAGSEGSVAVNGSGSRWTTGSLVIGGGTGGFGDAQIQLLNGGTLDAGTSTITIGSGGADSASLSIGGVFMAGAEDPGTLIAGEVHIDPNGYLHFNHTSTNYNFTPRLSGAGTIRIDQGANLLTADASTFTGLASVRDGALYVDTVFGGDVEVDIGRLGGHGSVGDVVFTGAGQLAGARGFTFSMQSLLLSPTATIDVLLGQPGNAALFNVAGNLTLDGTLEVHSAGGFGPGLYRLFDYGGTLTDNGLVIGNNLPFGVLKTDLSILTSIAGQVSLLDGPLIDYTFWDGGNTTQHDNGAVNGGDGVWDGSTPNWTASNGGSNGALQPNPAFNIFAGQAGTVTVSGTQATLGMQFATNGYTITGGQLSLAGAQTTIRVGDGTAAGAGMSATIASTLTGTGQVVKTDLGTLVLSGANSYSGGTLISAGTLRGAAGSFGTGDIDDGATLILEQASAGTLLNKLSGTGVVRKTGLGTLTLSGSAKTLGGQFFVDAGTLVIDNEVDGTLTVNGGARLQATNAPGASVNTLIVGAGGTLAGVAGNSFTIGSLALDPGAVTEVALGAPGNVALFDIGGNLTLDGTLNIVNAGSFGFGLYRLFDYGGTLTDNGLVIGSVPAGFSTLGLGIQTAVAGQVNLVSQAVNLTFWDGGGAALHGNGAIDGGSGVWDATSANWTDMGGTLNGPLTPNPSVTIFAGTAGTVTVSGTASTIGAQFATNGYVLSGGALSLDAAQTVIRVGDGTAAGAGMTATITSAIQGSGRLEKTDLGTLVLGGAGSYTGGTLVSAGTLTGGATSFGTGMITDNATLVLTGAGTLANSLTGSGIFRKTGSGTLTLGGSAGTFTGQGFVDGGTLVLDNQLRGTLTVNSGARLQATNAPGASAGNLIVAAGGTLAGVAGNNFSIQSLVLDPGATIEATLGGVNTLGLFNVTGNLTLDGTLNIVNAGGFGLGLYRLFDYGGTLTNNGLTIGSVPAGISPLGLSIQTAVAGQVNLVSQPVDLTFWDGGSAALHGNGVIDGGAGIWSASAANWTDSTGTGSGTFQPPGATAIFAGKGGAVTVQGTATVAGLQFAATGYTVSGDALSISAAQTMFRVGDGSAGGGQFAAVINSAITGSGGLAKTDLGTLTLSGVNDYAGGTLVGGGVLIGSATSFGTGTITDNAALVLQQANNAVLANAIAGTGLLQKTGVGTLSLTGNSSFTGKTDVLAGRLAVNGSLAGSAITVYNGASLGGTGTTGSVTVLSGGTIAPGNSIGTLHVSGNFAQGSNSNYTAEIDAAGHSDLIAVTGTAGIGANATLTIVKTDSAPYVLGTQYVLLTAAGGITGSYTLAGNTAISAFIGLTTTSDGKSLYLNVAQVHSFGSAALTPNQIATAGALDGLGQASVLVSAVASSPDAATAQAAFDQLSGEIHAAGRSALFADSGFVRRAALARMAEGGDTGLWAEAQTGSSTTDADGNAVRAKRSGWGMLIGVDAAPGGGWRLGAVGGYSSADFDLDARASRGSSDNYHLGAYARGQWGPVGLRLGAAWSWHQLSTRRTLNVAGLAGTLTGRYDGDTVQAFGEAGYRLDLGKGAVEPYAGLSWVRLSTDGFAEKGNAAALSAAKRGSDVTWSVAGLRGSADAGGGVTLRGAAAWQHGFGAMDQSAVLAFAGGTGFAVQTTPLARDTALVEAGLDVAAGRGLTFGLAYTGQFAGDLRSSRASARLALHF